MTSLPDPLVVLTAPDGAESVEPWAVQRNFEALADSASGPVTVTSMPTGSVADGTEVVYTADAASGTYWRFRRTGGEWIYQGGPPLQIESDSSENETLGSGAFAFQDALGTPSGLEFPLAGDYDVEFGYQCVFNAAADLAVEMRVADSAGTGLTQPVRLAGSWNGDRGTGVTARRVTIASAGTTGKLEIAGNDTTAAVFTTLARWVRITPRKVT